jgi:hypothetical protein
LDNFGIFQRKPVGDAHTLASLNPIGALLALAVVGAPALIGGVTSSASADSNASGSKNCTGHGKIRVRTVYQPYWGVQVAVKRAGPPNSDTWGTGAAGDGSSLPAQTVETVWPPSPYAEGRWSAYSKGNSMTARAECTQPRVAAPRTDRKATDVSHLGAWACSGSKKVRIIADSFSRTEVSYRSTPTSPRIVTTFPEGIPTFNDVRTGEAKVYDVVVKFFGGEPQVNHAYNTCF